MENQPFLQAVFDGIQDGISVMDLDLNIVQVNHAMEHWFPHMVPLPGKKCFTAYHLRSVPCQACPTLKAIQSGQPQTEEVPLTGPEGVNGWLELYAFPMYDDQGRITGAIEYVRNISKSKQAEAARRESEELLKLAMDNIPQAVFWKDRNLVYQGCNRRFAEDGGLASPEEIVGKTAFDMPWANKAAFYHSDDRIVLETDRPKLNIEEPLTRADGTQRWLMTNKLPMHDRDGKVVGVLTTYEDITERKQMEQYVLHTERLAAMGRMAAALAHEVNNPLHGIRNGLELVLNFSLEAGEQRQYLQATLGEIERLQALAMRVLDFARPPQIELRATSIAGVIRQALDLSSKQIQHSRIDVALILPDHMPEVLASPDHLMQVFLNLIFNAIEAMPQGGGLCISARVLDDHIELSFADTGTGIPPQSLPMIFEPFYTTKQDGTGLGLSVSYNIIRKHGGNITARNTPAGAVFILDLPLAGSVNAAHAREVEA